MPLLVGALGCGLGSGPDGASVHRGGSGASYRGEQAPREPAATVLAAHQLRVVPDVAQVAVDVRLRAKTFEESVDLGRSVTPSLRARWSQDEGCASTQLDRSVPERVSDKSWTSTVHFELRVSLKGMETVEQRAQQIEMCIGRVHAVEGDPKLAGVTIVVGRPSFELHDPTVYQQQLLRRRFAPLLTVASTTGAPSQFNVQALECTSQGSIRVVQRTLAGLTLEVDFDCNRGPAPPPIQPPVVAAAGVH
ncbi:MAG: hypothetical protein JKY37_02425 [Nannocystaceae bacterium]|nr:hypothetical protein [Nannocystaceae bacterium]